ncbi:MAG: recombinase family protein [Lachnospiraceae bacterium]
MARKKRLNPTAVLNPQSNTRLVIRQETSLRYSTAAYVRLSMKDSGKIDGYSLQNQQALLKEFIHEQNDLDLYKMYIDNGFTGTNFARPAFEEMIQDMKKGLINCIVVKDLSRLGRNYLETGKYLEEIFPFFEVRFISITDGYDSSSSNRTDQALSIPLKNMINEGYSKDISVKISSAIAARKKQGKFMAKYPPYGYLKDPNDKNHLVIDPDTCHIVQQIFQLRAQGMTLEMIAKTMNDKNIPCPARYLLLKGISKETRFAESFWTPNTVSRLLRNKVYLGMIVFGKEQSSLAKGIPRHTLPEKDWQTVEKTHQPIVDRQLFDAVQKQMEPKNSKSRK